MEFIVIVGCLLLLAHTPIAKARFFSLYNQPIDKSLLTEYEVNKGVAIGSLIFLASLIQGAGAYLLMRDKYKLDFYSSLLASVVWFSFILFLDKIVIPAHFYIKGDKRGSGEDSETDKRYYKYGLFALRLTIAVCFSFLVGETLQMKYFAEDIKQMELSEQIRINKELANKKLENQRNDSLARAKTKTEGQKAIADTETASRDVIKDLNVQKQRLAQDVSSAQVLASQALRDYYFVQKTRPAEAQSYLWRYQNSNNQILQLQQQQQDIDNKILALRAEIAKAKQEVGKKSDEEMQRISIEKRKNDSIRNFMAEQELLLFKNTNSSAHKTNMIILLWSNGNWLMRGSIIALYLILIVLELLSMLLDMLYDHSYINEYIAKTKNIQLNRVIEHAKSEVVRNFEQMKADMAVAVQVIKNTNDQIEEITAHLRSNKSDLIDVEEELTDIASISVKKYLKEYREKMGNVEDTKPTSTPSNGTHQVKKEEEQEDVPPKTEIEQEEEELAFFNS